VDFNKVIELDPQDVDAYNNRSIVKESLKDFEGAAADKAIVEQIVRKRD
jgi:hypothetical protein